MARHIELATVNMVPTPDGNESRNVVVRKGDFRTGDPCVYIYPDTQLADTHNPNLAFLRRHKMQVKKRRFMGVESNGIALTMDEIKSSLNPRRKYWIGYDMTSKLGAHVLVKGLRRPKTKANLVMVQGHMMFIEACQYYMPESV
jgi:hypothetical protein